MNIRTDIYTVLTPPPPSSLEPFLKLASENPDLLILVESAGPDLLPLIPTLVDTAPSLLPLLATLIKVPSGVLIAGGLASAGAGENKILERTTRRMARYTG